MSEKLRKHLKQLSRKPLTEEELIDTENNLINFAKCLLKMHDELKKQGVFLENDKKKNIAPKYIPQRIV